MLVKWGVSKAVVGGTMPYNNDITKNIQYKWVQPLRSIKASA